MIHLPYFIHTCPPPCVPPLLTHILAQMVDPTLYALPSGPSVSFDATLPAPDRPNTIPITHYKTDFAPTRTNLISVNDRLIVYAIKGGMIRVIEQNNALRTLLRGHTAPVKDLAFYSSTSDILASTAEDDTIIIWRVFDRLLDVVDPETNAEYEIGTDMLLKINIPATRVVWHPTDPNKILIVNGNDACLITTTNLNTESTDTGTTCTPKSLTDLGPILSGHTMPITDVKFTANASHAITSSADGTVKLWDLATFACVRTILPVLGPVTSVHFLHPADPTTAILIGTSNNSVLSTYTSPITGTPALLQTLTMTNPNPQHLNVNVDATGEFVCIGEFPARA